MLPLIILRDTTEFINHIQISIQYSQSISVFFPKLCYNEQCISLCSVILQYVAEQKVCFEILYTFFWKLKVVKRIQLGIIINVNTSSSCDVAVNFVIFLYDLNFLDRFQKSKNI